MHVDDLANAIGYLLKLKINNNQKLLKIIKDNSLINVGSGRNFKLRSLQKLLIN